VHKKETVRRAIFQSVPRKYLRSIGAITYYSPYLQRMEVVYILFCYYLTAQYSSLLLLMA